MRSRSLHCTTDWNKFLVIGHEEAGLVPAGGAWRYAYPLSSEDAEDDTGTGSPGQDAGADLRTHVPQGPLVAGAAHYRDTAHDLGHLRHRARFHRPLVLRAPVPLPDAFLLAVRQRRMRGGVEQPGPLVPGGAADRSLRAGVAAVRAGLPAVLLLLPAGLLPGVLARPRGPRGPGAPRPPYRPHPGPPPH